MLQAQYGKSRLDREVRRTATPAVGMDRGKWRIGRGFWQTGLTDSGQSHNALFCVNHYLFYGDDDHNLPAMGYGCEDTRKALMVDWIQQKHNGFSSDINAGKLGELERKIESMANWRPANYRDSELRDEYKQANELKAQETQQNISEWVDKLKDVGVKSGREFQRLCGCSPHTLHKYRSLWEHLLEVWKKKH